MSRGVKWARRAGWGLAAVLALLGVLLGWDRLTDAARVAVDALAAASVAFGVGWLLLLAAAALAVGLILSRPGGRTVAERVDWVVSPKGRWVVRFLVAVGLLAWLVLAIAVLPPRFTAHRHFDTATDELKAQNDVRTTLLQALAGGLLATGAYLTFRQLLVTREGQITDRYTKAVDQLGSDHLDVRLGGIYALERIARDSPDDRATIEEVLTAYVRGHAPSVLPQSSPALQVITERLATFAHRLRWLVAPARRRRSVPQRRTPKDPVELAIQAYRGEVNEEGWPPQGPSADVQAAVAVLGRRELPPDGVRPLDLTRVDLQGALLNGANLREAQLNGAKLLGAQLGGADLENAQLRDADLRGAQLRSANLQGAELGGANLGGAQLFGADLRGAGLHRVDLRGAELMRANLEFASLHDANLYDAWLQDANLEWAMLGPFINLQEASANEGTRWPVDWDRARAEAAGVRF